MEKRTIESRTLRCLQPKRARSESALIRLRSAEEMTLKTHRCFFLSSASCLKHPYRLLPSSFQESPSQWICQSNPSVKPNSVVSQPRSSSEKEEGRGEKAHLLVSPRVGQMHGPILRLHVGESVEDVRELLGRDVLR